MPLLPLVLRYWREAVITALVLGLVAACHRRDVAIRDRGRAEERARVADSTLKAVAPQLARTDTLLVRDTLHVTRLIRVAERDTLWRHDTVRVAGDTTPRLAVPVATVVRNDSTLRACSELASDCARFRAYANTTIAALESKLAAQPAMIVRSCTAREVISAAVGAGAGYYLARRR